jgi:hypothetical protein
MSSDKKVIGAKIHSTTVSEREQQTPTLLIITKN